MNYTTEEVRDYAALVEAMKLPYGYDVVEHLPGIWGYEYDRDDGERMASSASWNHPALAAIGAWRDHAEALAESAEPVAHGEMPSPSDADLLHIFSDEIGFEADDIQQVNAEDLLRISRAVLAAQSRAPESKP